MGIDRARLHGPLKAAVDRAIGDRQKDATTRPWSRAVPTVADGIRFASKTEARVYARLLREILPGEHLFCQIRLPLLVLGPGDKRRPESYLSIDFGITRAGKLVRLVDAKSKRVSRDWGARAAACRETWGIEIEEVEN